MVSINCIPTFRTLGEEVFDGILIPTKELVMKAAALLKELVATLIQEIIELFNLISDIDLSGLLDPLLDTAVIMGIPFTPRDFVDGDYSDLKVIVEDYYETLRGSYSYFKGLVSEALEFPLIIASMISDLIYGFTRGFYTLLSDIVIAIENYTAGTLSIDIPAINFPLDLDLMFTEMLNEGIELIWGFVIFPKAPPVIAEDVTVSSLLGGTLFTEDLQIPAFDISVVLSNLKASISSFIFSLVMDPIIKILDLLDSLFGVPVETLKGLLDLVTTNLQAIVDLIGGIHVCDAGEEFYSL